MPAYQSYFDNFFASLPISRANFKELGASTLRTLREAKLGAAFDPHEDALQAALNGFDGSLLDADESTTGDTEAFRTARRQWLTFVDDTMKDYVTPKLRKLPVYADFKKYQKTKLSQLPQVELLQQSKQLLELYQAYAATMKYPELPAEADAVYQQLAQAHAERDTNEATIGKARVALSGDWLALARALRRLKAQLELRFEEPAEVYRFFDFGRVNKGASVRKAAKQAAAPMAG
ncbi:hypothetical protein [Hymenobacter jeollabukensis]|uniref:Uncharacterized protein n=1 Tax=Hymenobacter jeollabukensis TaxID=2025313 RepID=A0A5R8WRE6_9BACT|nr:hypothetical protein [Hymenobacter jeollabukensis]TLM93324.1 hypothetical protein FDY95_11945 [Hymenobacter jeollabukensis]